MDLEKKQLGRTNRMGCITTNFILADVAIFALLLVLTGAGIAQVIRLILSVGGMVAVSVGYKKLQYDYKFRHICGIAILIAFSVTLLTSKVSYMYMYAFPIAIMLMIFQDPFLTKFGSIFAEVATLAYSIVSVVRGTMTLNEAILGYSLILIVCILGPRITALQVRNQEESMDAVKQGADVQAETSSSIVKLAEDLGHKFEQAKEVSDNLNESMSDSHSAVSEIAESSRVNAEAITEQTEQTSGIQMDIQEVGQQAKSMGQISENTHSTVEDGVRLISQLKMQAMEVAKINTETRATTQQLNESIKDVEAITETILGISSQTNLLALNASIEAARAGEAGKGFAVVADEIRNLSEDTRVATEQISAIINKLTKDAESAAESMTKSAEYAEKQNELIEETGEKLADIKQDTDTLYDGVKQVNASVDNIIEANQNIMNSITDLSATGEEVAASTDTALSLSESAIDALKEMNELLQEINSIANEMENVAAN